MPSATHTKKMVFQKEVLKRVFELYEQLQKFLLEIESHMVNNFSDEKWSFKPAQSAITILDKSFCFETS